MIVLHRNNKSPRADEIQARLEDLVVAHRVTSPEESGKHFDELPLIEEGDVHYVGDAIDSFMQNLENELAISRGVSADACYVSPDKPGSCT